MKTLREKSPFTKFFGRSVKVVKIDDDDAYPENMTCSPQSFIPLRYAVLQSNIDRFASDHASVPLPVDDEMQPTCLTNADVESHFRSVKRSRLSARLSACLSISGRRPPNCTMSARILTSGRRRSCDQNAKRTLQIDDQRRQQKRN